jgi:ferredoxin
MLALFVLIVAFSFAGTIKGGENLATVVTWGLWWTLIPFSFILLGRVWCAVCPITAVSDYLQRWLGGWGRLPGRFLKRYGVWIMSLSFLLLTWADRIWGIVDSPRATGVALITILGGSSLVALVYRRRVWCRYLCPIGALSGVYSMTSFVELRAKKEVCRKCKSKSCYRGTEKIEGCPLYEFPMNMESNRNCNLCANCLKACPHGSVELRLRPPGRELWQVEKPILGESALAVLMVALVYMQTAGMAYFFPSYMKWAVESLEPLSYNFVFTLTMVGAVGVGAVLYLSSSWASSRVRKEGFKTNLASFGYALVPLALAGHFGHNIFHLGVEGKAALQAAISQLHLPLQLFPLGLSAGEEFHHATIAIKALQALALASGTAWSGFVVWRLAVARSGDIKGRLLKALPHLVMVLLVGGLFLHLLLVPMNLRHVH